MHSKDLRTNSDRKYFHPNKLSPLRVFYGAKFRKGGKLVIQEEIPTVY